MPAHDTTPTMKQQARHARSEALTMLVRMGVPWAVFIALTVMGNVLYIALAKAVDHGEWIGLTAALVLFFGLASAGFDWHLRRHRMSAAGQLIGPATIVAGSVMTGTFLLTGYWVPLVLTYMFGGIAASVGWDAWLHHAVHHDLSIGFSTAAEKAGLGTARVLTASPARRSQDATPRPPRPRRRAARVLSGTVALDGGEVTPADAAARAANLEGALGYPPGALGLTQNARHGGFADYTVSDPASLAQPLPWPGPSAPGADMSVPFRLAVRQDGEAWLVSLLPVFHTRATGMTGSGKALALDTPVPTPSGWSTMGDLRDGDEVFDDQGCPCRVVKAHPVRYERPCYEVRFSDGSVITADAEHLWGADVRQPQNGTWGWMPQVVTTEQMASSLCFPDGHRRYSVRVAGALQLPEVDLPVPPYTLGAWLGDGTALTGALTVADREIIAEVEAEGLSARVVPSTVAPGKTPLYRVAGLSRLLVTAGIRSSSWVPRLAGPCGDCGGGPRAGRGLCQGCFDARKNRGTLPPREVRTRPARGFMQSEKHIPVAYLRAAEQQRRALLAGLLDTDGYCTKGGTAEFCNTNERLARDVLHLVSGLGYKASLRSRPARLYGKDCGTVWTVAFTPADKVFRLPRKLARQVTSARASAVRRYVTAVVPVASVPVRCITVDSPSSLYLAGRECIPTHNTMSWLWNRLAEGVTREGYGMVAVDVTKMWQYLGPVRAGLHAAAVDPESALRLFAALERVRRARLEYLAKMHMTEWTTGCGLSYLDIALEELGEILRALAEASRGSAGAPFDLQDWFTNVRAGRSTGMSWNVSNQSGSYKSFPTEVRGNFHSLTFGMDDGNDVRPALSDRQALAGVRPTLWGSSQPGTAVADFEGMSDAEAAMTVRFYDWGRSPAAGHAISAYMEDREAAGRPLDDVTAEAMADEPPLPDSYYPPAPRRPGRPRKDDRTVVAGPWKGAAPRPAQYEQAEQAERELFGLWLKMYAEGTETFTVMDMVNSKVLDRLGKSRPWLYLTIATGVQTGRCEKVADKPKQRWRIIPPPARARMAEEEEM